MHRQRQQEGRFLPGKQRRRAVHGPLTERPVGQVKLKGRSRHAPENGH